MTARQGPRPPLDVYLQPAVVGGGLGDIEEVLAVGRRLERAGWRPRLYRRAGRPLPPSVVGPWGWPAVHRMRRILRRAPRAMTVTPWWGVAAAPASERSGPAGAWSLETGDIEREYGKDRVVHLSLEEFARTLTSREQTKERWREGGTGTRVTARRLRQADTVREIRQFHDAYRKWRAFDRPNVLHLFTGFRPSRAFRREFPEAIQAGPLWPDPATRPRRGNRPRRWIWYASPSTSARLAAELARAVPPPSPGSSPLQIDVRGPRRFELPPGPGLRWRWIGPRSPRSWSRLFRSADLRLVTGSRTLLEAVAVGGPFLYFNGVMNRGSRTRRHRPEKIGGLLDAWKRLGVSRELRNDLADFSRLRRASSVIRRAVLRPSWSRQFPDRTTVVASGSFPTDAGRLIEGWTWAWARAEEPAGEFVARARKRAGGPSSRL